jgi:hypothetical protein
VRKLFGGVCGKKASLKIAWDAFRAVGATFRLFLGVYVATETSEGATCATDVVQFGSDRFADSAPIPCKPMFTASRIPLTRGSHVLNKNCRLLGGLNILRSAI